MKIKEKLYKYCLCFQRKFKYFNFTYLNFKNNLISRNKYKLKFINWLIF